MSSEQKITPLMKQYWEVKSLHQDKILFFRMGDFYELFDQDAITAAPILGIALTSRNKNTDSTAMCGMPYHSVASYINKLLSYNFKVAICDQIEDPKTAKGIVKRAVTRVLSPGMVYDPETLEFHKNNYLCSFDETSVSFLESSTGEAFFYNIENENQRDKLIELLNPVEIVLDSKNHKLYLEKRKSVDQICVSLHELTQTFEGLKVSSQRLLSYAIFMQGREILNTTGQFLERKFESRLEISSQTFKHLEVFKTYSGEERGSLFSAINKTKTAAGSRKLKNWLLFPLKDKVQIMERQDQIQSWINRLSDVKKVREFFSQMGDIERRLGKISNPNCNGRDLVALKESLKSGLSVEQILRDESIDLRSAIKVLEEIEKTIIDEPPLSTRLGHMIKSGFSLELDEMIQLTTDSQSLLSAMEQREKESTGISSLKIRYNQVFGFYIEITKVHLEKIPKHYVRKQTLANAERFITDELYTLEQKILSAQTKRFDLEFSIFENLKHNILKVAPQLISLAHRWAELDVITSFAWLSVEHNYSRPDFSNDRSLRLKASRHPVIEQLVNNKFIPNDFELFPNGCLLLTGPNMAGKSTLMRQIALISLLAQVGSFVPASVARLPLFDKIFTRIGASDSLSEGLSTFMVEMTETAFILKNATPNSLIILDEIGRGTSTFDGMSLAQAICEYIVLQIRSLTLFATHYHELTILSQKYPQIINAHMTVSEDSKKEIQFLYTLAMGAANRSYGIDVARLAGLPTSVTNSAKKILEKKEFSRQDSSLPLFSTNTEQEELSILRLEENKNKHVLEEIANADVMNLSPMKALEMIDNWKKRLDLH